MIKLVHISDLHFSAVPQWADAIELISSIKESSIQGQILRALRSVDRNKFGCHDEDVATIAASFIRDEFLNHDAILISGDLATRGFEADLNLARSYILDPPQKSDTVLTLADEPTLNVNDKPIIVMPGNHDRYDDLLAKCAGKQFDTTFRDIWPCGLRGVQAAIVTGTSGENLCIVCADFTLASWWNADPRGIRTRYGQGRATQRVVNELLRVSEEARLEDPNVAIIWSCHFPPAVDFLRIPNELRLVEHHRVIKAAKSFGVEYILCGHTHMPKSYVDGSVEIIVAGSMCVPNVNFGCWIHSLSFNIKGKRATLVDRENYQYDFNQSMFVKR